MVVGSTVPPSSALGLFAAILLAATLLSAFAQRTAFSTAVLFIAAGFAAGSSGLGWVHLDHGSDTVQALATVALFCVLYSDGMEAGAAILRRIWGLSARALLVGMPLSIAIAAAIAVSALGLTWTQALLVSAVLAPTDPVFASGLVRRDDVPTRLRQLLNVESGLNDGLALPVVVVLLGLLGAPEPGIGRLILDVAGGAALGIALAFAAAALRRCAHTPLPRIQASLFVLSVGVLAFALAQALEVNLYLCAYCAGATLATRAPRTARTFAPAGEYLSELSKFATLFAFGVLLPTWAFTDIGWSGWLFVAGLLLVARPVSIAVSLAGTQMPVHERMAAAWFGPKGFASVVYALMVAASHVPRAGKLFELAAVAVTVSIVAHSTTDVPIARWLARDSQD